MYKNHTNDEYRNNGVTIHPSTPHAHDNAQLSYNGLLSQNGASEVYAHIGFDANWTKTHDYRMEKTSRGYEVAIPVQSADTLNVAFKDCANNWDNNSGKNYTFDINR
jgi:hypothetical protein